jgi:valyl-tRNA synthetase
MERVMAGIKAVRALRAEKNVPPSKKVSMTVVTENVQSYLDGEPFLRKLAGAGEVSVTAVAMADAGGCAVAITEDARIYLPLAELVDVEKELQRIAKELKKAEGQAAGMKAKLSNEAFLSKAPEQVVAAEREKARKLDALVENLRESAAKLRALR